jgi:hypothetical protein
MATRYDIASLDKETASRFRIQVVKKNGEIATIYASKQGQGYDLIIETPQNKITRQFFSDYEEAVSAIKSSNSNLP